MDAAQDRTVTRTRPARICPSRLILVNAICLIVLSFGGGTLRQHPLVAASQDRNQLSKPAPRAQSPLAAELVGSWSLPTGRTLIVFSDGSFDLFQGSNLIDGGQWAVTDPETREVRFTHRLGMVVDTVVLSADLRSFDGTNTDRQPVRGTKRTVTPARGSLDAELVGTWIWVAGRTIVIYADGTFDLHQDGRLIGGGQWTVLDASIRTLRLTYRPGGTVDTVALSADGRTLTGTSSDGAALRLAKRSVAVAAGTIDADLVGTWNWVSGRTFVVFGDGTFDLYQGSNLIGGGQWVIADPARRQVRLTHRGGRGVDTVTLSADGRVLEGKSSDGGAVKGTKR